MPNILHAIMIQALVGAVLVLVVLVILYLARPNWYWSIVYHFRLEPNFWEGDDPGGPDVAFVLLTGPMLVGAVFSVALCQLLARLIPG